MEQPSSLFAKLRNVALIVAGLIAVFVGAQRYTSRTPGGHAVSSATPFDGVAHAEAPACAEACSDGGACGCGCGCGDDGGC